MNPISEKTAVVVCMLDSIHSARWLEQFSDQEIDFVLFPSSPSRRIHPQLNTLLERNTIANYKIVPFGKWFGLPLWILDKFTNNFFRGTLLRWTIKRHKPDILHALELQNAGYVSLRALSKHKPVGLRFIATNWGSDIFWFQRFPKHRAKLQALLKLADAYSAECHRDVALAKELGFTGEALPVIPNAGGFSKADLSMPLLTPDKRKTIALKGYHGWVGRAKVSLEAVGGLAEELKDYKFVVYSANRFVIKLAKQVAKETGLDITAHAKGSLSHQQVLELFAKSKIYVGLSESDGISTSMLEAMAMGTIPVQTSTACCDEWFKDSGVAVREITVQAVKNAIEQGLVLAEDPSNAKTNRKTIELRANAEDVQKIALTFYN
jgi:glycosyltransferase involved in cell wall biosynthesis